MNVPLVILRRCPSVWLFAAAFRQRLRSTGIALAAFAGLVLPAGGQVPEISVEYPAGTSLAIGKTVGWGSNGGGQTTIPTGAQSLVVALAGGSKHSAALKTNGSVIAWGTNDKGQTTVPAEASSGVIALSVGSNHCLALKSDGRIVAWGSNSVGQTTIPAALQGSAIAIAANSDGSAAVNEDGAVVVWGSNAESQQWVPAAAQAEVTAVAMGTGHVVALRADGRVVAWGRSSEGQAAVPASALSGVVAISAGAYHTVALKADGSVLAWGMNTYGQTAVPSAAQSGVVAVAAGGYHTLALKSNGSIVAWGYNADGEINVPSSTTSKASVMAAGTLHSLAVVMPAVPFPSTPLLTSSTRNIVLKNTGTAFLNLGGFSITGDDSADFAVETSSPPEFIAPGESVGLSLVFTPVIDGPRRAVLRIASDDADEPSFDIALTGTAVTRAEIAVFSGAVPDPAQERADNSGTFILPDTFLPNDTVQSFTIQNTGLTPLHDVAVTITGASVRLFELTSAPAAVIAPGETSVFQVKFHPSDIGVADILVSVASNDANENPFRINVRGTALAPDILVEQPAGTAREAFDLMYVPSVLTGSSIPPSAAHGVVAVAAGFVNMALKADGSVVWWDSSGPLTVPTAARTNNKAIALGADAVMFLKRDNGEVQWWRNHSSTLSTVPVEAQSGVTAIAAGSDHLLALKANGSVIAWGSTVAGETTVPPDAQSQVVAIAAGWKTSAALRTDGRVVAWGDPSFPATTVPAAAQSGVVAIAAGRTYFVALKSDGSVVQWGSLTSVPPEAQSGVRRIFAGAGRTVAEKNDGSLIAWGTNSQPLPAVCGLGGVTLGDYGTFLMVPPRLDFGTRRLSDPLTQTVVVRNVGNIPLHIGSVEITGADAADFALSMAGLTTVVPATTGSTAFDVSFVPTSLGAKSACLTVHSDDPDEPKTVFWLNGDAIADGEVAVYLGADASSGQVLTTPQALTLFSNIPVGVQASQTFTIENQGTGPLHGLAVALSGTGAADYAVTQPSLGQLEAGEQKTFVLAFQSQSLSARSATLSIVSDDGDENPFVINVTATAVGPKAAMFDGNSVALDSSLSGWGAGGILRSVPARVQKQVQAVAAGNSRFLALKTSGEVVEWSGTPPVESAVPALAQTDVVAIEAGFENAAAIRKNGDLVVWGDDSAGQLTVPNDAQTDIASVAVGDRTFAAVRNDGSVVVWGAGAATNGPLPPEALTNVEKVAVGSQFVAALKSDGSLALWGQYDDAQAQILPPTFAYGNRSIEASGDLLAIVRDTGKIERWQISSALVAPVLQSVVTLPALAAEFEIAGPRQIALTRTGGVTANTGGVSPDASVPAVLASNVIDVASGATDFLALNPGGIAFGPRQINAPPGPRQFVLRNFGTAPMHVGAIALDGPHASEFTLGALALPATISPGGQTAVAIDFIPSHHGFRTAVLHIQSDGFAEGQYDLVVSGLGLPGGRMTALLGDSASSPEIVLSSVEMGSAAASQGSVVQAFTVKNTGSTDLLLEPPLLTGLNVSDFSVSRVDGTRLAPGAVLTFSVTFSPTAAGTRSTNLRILSDDPARPTFEVRLTGLGIVPEIEVLSPSGVIVSSGGVVTQLIGTSDPDGVWSLPAGSSSGVDAIAVGTRHAMALKQNGSVLTWGNLAAGSLAIPQSVQGNVAAIDAGTDLSVLLLKDGSGVGLGTASGQKPADWTTSLRSLMAGNLFAAGLKNDGQIVPWSFDTYGEGTIPPDAAGHSKSIAVGQRHMVALRTDGRVVAWGDNTYGQTDVPAAAQGGVIAIDAGTFHSIALKKDGSVVVWGSVMANGYPYKAVVPGAVGTGLISAFANGYRSGVLYRNGGVLLWDAYSLSYPFVPYLGKLADVRFTDSVAVGLTGALVDFGDSAVFRSAQSRTVSVKSASAVPLRLSSIELSGDSASAFAISAPAVPVELAANGEQMTIDIGFSPVTAGLHKARLRIVSNDPDEPATDLMLVGFGIGTPFSDWLQPRIPVGTSPSSLLESADPDGDGATNLEEFAAQTDPFSASGMLRVTTVGRTGSLVDLKFHSEPGVRYTLWESDSLSSNTWAQSPASEITGDGTDKLFEVTGPIGAGAKRFYRIKCERIAP